MTVATFPVIDKKLIAYTYLLKVKALYTEVMRGVISFTFTLFRVGMSYKLRFENEELSDKIIPEKR